LLHLALAMAQTTPSTSSSRPVGGALGAIGRLLLQPIGSGAARASGSGRGIEKRPATSVGHRQMRRDLYTLLERHPASRQTMRRLDVIERTLRHTGMNAVEALPLPVLAKGLAELESLVWDWSVPGLAEVRSRLAVAVKRRRHEADAPGASPFERYGSMPPAIDADVQEVSHELFEEMERSWTGRMPGEPAVQHAMSASEAAETVPAVLAITELIEFKPAA
jgi:hypothetical protein